MHFRYLLGGFVGDFLPLGSGIETSKDEFLSVDKILFFWKRASYFAFYKKNYVFNENVKNSLDYQ